MEITTFTGGTIDGLVRLIRACVDAGASLGFLAPMSEATAVEYWESILPEVENGTRVLLTVLDGDEVIGSGQLRYENRENGRHRAEVVKVMVHPSHRRAGIATRIMRRLEEIASAAGITLLYLDTSIGPGGAATFYERLGWTHAGGIPGYALDPDGTPADNAIFYKR